MLTNSYHILPFAFFLVILLIQKAISVKTLSLPESISQDMCTLMNMSLFPLWLYPLVHHMTLVYIPHQHPFLHPLYLHNPLLSLMTPNTPFHPLYLLLHHLLHSLMLHHHLHSLLIHRFLIHHLHPHSPIHMPPHLP